MKIKKLFRLWVYIVSLTVAAFSGVNKLAMAQDLSLNYDRLSSFEEPLAIEYENITFVLTGLVDAALTSEQQDSSDDQANGNGGGDVIGNFQISAQTQLSNRLRVNLAYFGQYTDNTQTISESSRYTDNVGLSVGGAWGSLLSGNVSGIVREQTRRLRGVGNASLEFDDFLGSLEDWGNGYTGRFGPLVVSTLIDRGGNIDLGVMYQRPTGTKDYRLTARYMEGFHTSPYGASQFDTRGFSVVGELIYGSTKFDIGVGGERILSNTIKADRWSVSSGIRHKTGVHSWSIESHYGQIEGKATRSSALGYQYDLARGLSLNLGINYRNAKVDIDDVISIDRTGTSALLSLRYSI